jgi:pimeloyl-ACP methyl ester carboxylesterase
VVVPNLIKLDQYNRLGNFLSESLGYERGKDLLEFAYDWRQDCRASASRLGAEIEAWRERSDAVRGPVTIIAHSLGCLVSRYYVEHLGGHREVDRLVLVGGPHQGVPQAIPTIVSGPKLLPFGALGERIRDVIRTFPSVYQILPVFPCAHDEEGQPIDVLRDDSWLSNGQRAMLHDARLFREELGYRTSVPTVCIFGYGLNTITGVKVRRAAREGWERIELALKPSGDEAIPDMSAVLDGAGIHPVHQHHGSLYTDNDVKMRLALELARGVRPVGD